MAGYDYDKQLAAQEQAVRGLAPMFDAICSPEPAVNYEQCLAAFRAARKVVANWPGTPLDADLCRISAFWEVTSPGAAASQFKVFLDMGNALHEVMGEEYPEARWDKVHGAWMVPVPLPKRDEFLEALGSDAAWVLDLKTGSATFGLWCDQQAVLDAIQGRVGSGLDEDETDFL